MGDSSFELKFRYDSRYDRALDQFSARKVPVFSRSSLPIIAQLIDQARSLNRGYEAPDFAAFTMIACKYAPGAIRRNFSALFEAELCEGCPFFVRYKVDENFDCRGIGQDYLGKAPIGVEAEYCWDLQGGAGQGIRLADVERGWILNHPDLEGMKVCPAPGGYGRSDGEHGLGVLGIIAAPKNGMGVTGIVHSVDCIVISHSYREELGCESIADAMVSAAGELCIGDILLVEFFDGGNDQRPIEQLPSVFETIRLLTAAGISVIEPAGNGKGKVAFKKDSGAIMVGAVDSIFSPRESYSVSCFSNFGPRVDCYAWGRCIRTTTIAGYNYGVTGTSGASAIIAGVAAALQGVSKAQEGKIILPGRMRRILGETGAPVKRKSKYEKGRVPNLREMVEGGLSRFPV